MVLSVTFALSQAVPLLMLLIVGPVVIIVLVANVLELDDSFPDFLNLPHLDSWRVLGFLGLILVIFLFAVGTEVLLLKPDLRPDGIHGIIAPKLLGFAATPIMLYDLEEKHVGLMSTSRRIINALYVLYDPCAEEVRLVPVGASRVVLIDEVDCRSP